MSMWGATKCKGQPNAREQLQPLWHGAIQSLVWWPHSISIYSPPTGCSWVHLLLICYKHNDDILYCTAESGAKCWGSSSNVWFLRDLTHLHSTEHILLFSTVIMALFCFFYCHETKQKADLPFMSWVSLSLYLVVVTVHYRELKERTEHPSAHTTNCHNSTFSL